MSSLTQIAEQAGIDISEDLMKMDDFDKEETTMAETVKGVIERVNLNNSGYYGTLLGGEWFGSGKSKPVFNEGDEVSFDYTMNGKYKNLVEGSETIIAAGQGKPAPARQAASGGGGTNWDLKDKRITYLASRKDAIELARAAVDTDSLTLPAKKADRMEALLAAVNTLTQDLYKDVYGEEFEVPENT